MSRAFGTARLRWLSVFFLACFCLQPASAMTPEDCLRLRDMAAKTVPAVSQLRISPAVTEDLWCRVIDGPLGPGWDWRMSQTSDSFTLEVRKDRLTYDTLGPFRVEGRVETLDQGSVRIGPITLGKLNGDVMQLAADFGALGDGETDAVRPMHLAEGQLLVQGAGGLVNDVLSWAFRQDLQSARSSLIAAREQRDEMERWLTSSGADVTDAASVDAFRKILDAYPNARGTAVLSAGADGPVDMGALVMSVLTGSDFSRGDAAALIARAGLRLSWRPK